MRAIVTQHVYPPIPAREWDWMAHYDGDEEGGPRGFGYTKEAAIADLTENFPDDGPAEK